MTMPWDQEAEVYLRTASQYRHVSREEDPILGGLRLAIRIAGQYRGRGVDYADLIGEAQYALIVATRQYPRSKAAANGVSRTTYVARAIHHHLLRIVREAAPVHIPQDAWQHAQRVASRDGSDESIAAEVGLSVQQVRRLRQVARMLEPPKRWDEPAREDEDGPFTLAEVIPDPDEDVEAKALRDMELAQLRREMAAAVAALPPVARLAISLSFAVPVPQAAAVSLQDVVQASIAHNRENGLARLRRRMPRDASTGVVQEGRSGAVHLAYSPVRPGSEARRRRDQALWRRLAGEPAPKALVTA